MPADTEKPNAAFSKSINFSYNRIQKKFLFSKLYISVDIEFLFVKIILVEIGFELLYALSRRKT